MYCEKPKITKGLTITKGNIIYDKIVSLSVYGDEVYFSNMESESVRVNIDCKLKDISIKFGDD